MNSSTASSDELVPTASKDDGSMNVGVHGSDRRGERQPLSVDLGDALGAGDLPAARRCIEEAIRRSPDAMLTYLLRARLLAHEDETESALALARDGLQGGSGADVEAVSALLSLVANLGGPVTV